MKLLPFISMLMVFTAQGAELDGVKMADQVSVSTHTLKLNGLGTRRATIFAVKVYIAGLYVETPSKNPDQLLASPEVKRVDMHFVHGVSASQLRNAWVESFEKNCGPDCDALKPALEKLNNAMADLNVGDHMVFTFLPGEVDVQVKDQAPVKIENKLYPKVLLSTWLGANPPNESLKKGMLGES